MKYSWSILSSVLLLFVCTLPALGQKYNVDSLQNELTQASNDSEKAPILILLGVAAESTDPNLALSYYDQAYRITKGTDIKAGGAVALSNKGFAYLALGKQDSSILSLNNALNIYSNRNDSSGQLMTAYNLGVFHASFNNPPEAIVAYNYALDLSIQQHETSYRHRILNNLSLMHSRIGNMDSAASILLSALKLREKLYPKDLGKSYGNLALLYSQNSNYSEAEKYFLKSMQHSQKEGKPRDEVQAQINLAKSYIKTNKLTAANQLLDQALEVAKRSNLENNIADIYSTKADIAFEQNNLPKAISYNKKALKALPELASSIVEFNCLINLANHQLNLYKNTNQKTLLPDIEMLCKRALKLSPAAKLDNRKKIYQILSEVSMNTGQLQQASYQMQQAFKIADSLIISEREKKQAQIQAQYELEKKELKIGLLNKDKEINQNKLQETEAEARFQKQSVILVSIGLLVSILLLIVIYRLYNQKRKTNAVLTDQNTTISLQNDEKELLLKEIHHRVKNNLQVITSILEAQSATITDNRAITALAESQGRIKSMAVIHQELYLNDNLGSINFTNYTEQLFSQIRSLYPNGKHFNQRIEAPQTELDLDTAIPIGLILNELLSNSFKHAFLEAEKGTISVQLTQEKEGHFKLTIEDDGKPLDQNFSLQNCNSLGLKLVSRLARQLHGKFDVASNPHKSFNINFLDSTRRKETE